MRKPFFTILLAGALFGAAAQAADSLSIPRYKVGLMLPFMAEGSNKDIDDFFNAPDVHTANRISLNNYAVEALDFYQGMRLGFNENNDSLFIDLHVFDCQNSDSVTEVLLKTPEVNAVDILVGPSGTSNARLAAEHCLSKKILNVQPFTPSKSLTLNNPYHLKLAPTIDAHVDNIFLSLLDTFAGCNVVIYAPDNEIGKSTAQRFDSLFKDYNLTGTLKFTVANINYKLLSAAKEKKNVSDYLSRTKRNVLIITGFEGSFVNNTLRLLTERRDNYDVVVYGMPTWMGSEVMRLDYLNDFNARISDPFYADTLRPATLSFITNYQEQYGKEPTEMGYLGYDVARFLLTCLHLYGKNFVSEIVTQRFTGVGYKFDIMKEAGSGDTVNYYENRHVNVFKINDYHLMKIW